MGGVVTFLLLTSALALPQRSVVRPAAPFATPLTLWEMTAKQAVVTISAGTFVMDLKPEVAATHVGYFIKLAREGAFNGTILHRVIRLGIIQGGDPLSKDPAKVTLYGTGGLGVLKAELGAESARRGRRGPAAWEIYCLRPRRGRDGRRRDNRDVAAERRSPGHARRAEDGPDHQAVEAVALSWSG